MSHKLFGCMSDNIFKIWIMHSLKFLMVCFLDLCVIRRSVFRSHLKIKVTLCLYPKAFSPNACSPNLYLSQPEHRKYQGIVKIILLCTHLYLSSFQYLSITCNAFIACYIIRKKYLIGKQLVCNLNSSATLRKPIKYDVTSVVKKTIYRALDNNADPSKIHSMYWLGHDLVIFTTALIRTL